MRINISPKLQKFNRTTNRYYENIPYNKPEVLPLNTTRVDLVWHRILCFNTENEISKRDRKRNGNRNIWGCKGISRYNMIKNVQKLSGKHQWITKNKRYSNTQTLDQGPQEIDK